jgi:hypothetical protein
MTNALSPGNNPRTHEIGEWLDPTTGMTRFGKHQNLLPLPRMEPRYFGCPARRLDTIPPELSRIPTVLFCCFN